MSNANTYVKIAFYCFHKSAWARLDGVCGIQVLITACKFSHSMPCKREINELLNKSSLFLHAQKSFLQFLLGHCFLFWNWFFDTLPHHNDLIMSKFSPNLFRIDARNRCQIIIQKWQEGASNQTKNSLPFWCRSKFLLCVCQNVFKKFNLTQVKSEFEDVFVDFFQRKWHFFRAQLNFTLQAV